MTSPGTHKLLIRAGTQADVAACTNIATDAFHIFNTERRREHLRERASAEQLLVALMGNTIAGYATYDKNWFRSTFLKLVVVDGQFQRQGIATALIRAIARDHCPHGRLFSSTEDDNAPSLALHQRLGFIPSGYLDNLPQPGRELFFFLDLT